MLTAAFPSSFIVGSYLKLFIPLTSANKIFPIKSATLLQFTLLLLTESLNLNVVSRNKYYTFAVIFFFTTEYLYSFHKHHIFFQISLVFCGNRMSNILHIVKRSQYTSDFFIVIRFISSIASKIIVRHIAKDKL